MGRSCPNKYFKSKKESDNIDSEMCVLFVHPTMSADNITITNINFSTDICQRVSPIPTNTSLNYRISSCLAPALPKLLLK